MPRCEIVAAAAALSPLGSARVEAGADIALFVFVRLRATVLAMTTARDFAMLQAVLDDLTEGGEAEVSSPPPHVISEYLEILVRIRRKHAVPRLPLEF